MSDDREQADCTNCSTTLDLENDLVLVGNGDLLCEDCRIYCERCAEWNYDDGSRYIEGEGTYCSNCADNYTFWCGSCENLYSDDVPNYHIADVGDYWCEGCASEHAEWCDDCDTYNRDGCDECSSGGKLVHDYSYKPSPVFYGDGKLFFGLELEMEIRSGDMLNSSQYVRDNVGEFVYLKNDSSINSGGYNGFELVSHPATLDYHTNNNKLWDTLDYLREHESARSWDAKSCGIHIHINRTGFKGGAHTHRFLTLIYKNAEQMMRLAGRKSTYARFNDCWQYDEYDKPYFTLQHKLLGEKNNPFYTGGERYSAVNTNNQHTLELRFFRGTTKPSGVLSAIELAHAGVEYTRDLTLSDVKMGALTWDWFYDWVQSNNGLYPNLYTRMAKVQGLTINSQEIVNA
jgi:hypothetical protein